MIKRVWLLFSVLILSFFDVFSQDRPALIPLPQKLTWNEGAFSIQKARHIVVSDERLMPEAAWLKQQLPSKSIQVKVNKQSLAERWSILLVLDTTSLMAEEPEAYTLDVHAQQIRLVSSTRQGIFYGIQTLQQLIHNGSTPACSIRDWPAFSWRGYMIDVGRNYMSIPLLKQQIDVMAAYKFNVFHFHATEDIAWRIEIPEYPELTAPETMIRRKGKFYTEQEIKDLIAYCTERHITFVPEIDMPGHSAAFRLALKTDMQSDSGMNHLRKILRSFCTTYDVPYLHIGADEVKITNPEFIPSMTAYIQQFGKQVIGWEPGGNFTAGTIRQLWREDPRHPNAIGNYPHIDSRHLYLNHMDPLESVVTLFHRQIAGKSRGDNLSLGATLCMWHDRNIAEEEDVLRMNPVYPGMLAFAERTWRGGGQSGWIANVSDGNVDAFEEFERRLMQHKQLYFQGKYFPYVKQSHQAWELFGPYANEGEVRREFEEEQQLWADSVVQPAKRVLDGAAIEPALPDAKIVHPVKQIRGGTVVLRHWWAPLIKGAIDEPKENTTWYARTRIWSDKNRMGHFWIGFNNLSRSPATDTPPKDGWDDKGSAVWVNGSRIAPPTWARAGQRGDLEIPLVDEGYEYRTPTRIPLHKGWNTVVLKMPIATFRGKEWQQPVKWMFTFVEVAAD